MMYGNYVNKLERIINVDACMVAAFNALCGYSRNWQGMSQKEKRLSYDIPIQIEACKQIIVSGCMTALSNLKYRDRYYELCELRHEIINDARFSTVAIHDVLRTILDELVRRTLERNEKYF